MKKFFKWVFIILSLTAFTGFIFYKTSRLPMNSDGATMLLYADDILNGNLFLSGWTLSGLTFLTTDLPFFIVSVAIFGVSLKAFQTATALMYLFMSFSALFACLYGLKRKGLGIALISGIGLFPTTYLLSNAFVHTASFGNFFLAAGFIGGYLRTKKKINLYLLSVVTMLSVCGDGISICLITIPALLVFILAEKDIKGSVSVISGTALGLILTKVYITVGGADLNTLLEQSFIDPYKIWDNILLYTEYYLRLINAYFFSKDVFSVKTLFFAVKILISIFSIYIVFRSVRKALRKERYDGVILFSGLGFLLVTAVLFITTINTNITAGRYLGFLPLMIGVIISREADNLKFLSSKKISISVSALCVLLALTGIIPSGSGFSPYNTYSDLALFLETEGLTNGIGCFWDASVITGYSGKKVSVRPCLFEDGKIQPRIWFCNLAWYSDPIQFVIVRDGPSETEALNYNYNGIFHMRLNAGEMFNMSKDNVIMDMGEPKEIKKFRNYSILVYKD